jgi:hypothetical protein
MEMTDTQLQIIRNWVGYHGMSQNCRGVLIGVAEPFRSALDAQVGHELWYHVRNKVELSVANTVWAQVGERLLARLGVNSTVKLMYH